MRGKETSYSLYYPEFEYKGYKESYFYDVPFDSMMKAIRTYFSNQLIDIDGKDSDVWNALADLECIDNIFDVMEDWLHEYCEKDAYEDFKEYVDYYELYDEVN